MNKFTRTVKSVIAGAALALASISASAEIIVGEHFMYFSSWNKVEAFCGNSFITCTSISPSGTGYLVGYTS